MPTLVSIQSNIKKVRERMRRDGSEHQQQQNCITSTVNETIGTEDDQRRPDRGCCIMLPESRIDARIECARLVVIES